MNGFNGPPGPPMNNNIGPPGKAPLGPPGGGFAPPGAMAKPSYGPPGGPPNGHFPGQPGPPGPPGPTAQPPISQPPHNMMPPVSQQQPSGPPAFQVCFLRLSILQHMFNIKYINSGTTGRSTS